MISEIFENTALKIDNVLHYHALNTQTEINEAFQKIERLLLEKNVKKNGNICTATRNLDVKNGITYLDFDIFVPLEKNLECSPPFEIIEHFEVNNALMIRIKGNPRQSDKAMEMLGEFMKSKNYLPVTPAIIATIKGANTPSEIDEMIMEIYVGVKDSQNDK